MVSCEGEKSYRARLVQIIHGDTTPEGPGYKEKSVKADFERDYKARETEHLRRLAWDCASQQPLTG